MEFLSQHIENLMLNGGTIDNHQIRQLCKAEGIELYQNITKVKEAVELGLMHAARTIVQSDTPLRSKYDKLIDIYNRQPYVGTKKTLKQMFLQQYSTSLPIAFLMSEFVKSKSHSALYFEPSAGNGFLTISLPQENTICNEIDKYRLANLRGEHYRKVTEQDSRHKFEYDRIFDGVITNPPFLKEVNTLIFNALDTMKNDGRCAILRDGNASFTDYLGTKLRSSFTGFFDRLFQEYNVVKIININSKKIYAKQGTSFFMQIILIDGRRPQKGSSDETIHRVFNPERDKTDLAGFEELWQYFLPYISENDTSSTEVFDERETMRMAFNHLIKELGEDKGREVFEWYCKTYNVGISDPMPSTVKWEIFGTEKKFREIDRIKKAKTNLLKAELELLVEVGDEFKRKKQLSLKQRSRIEDWLRTKPIKDKEIYEYYSVSWITPSGEIGLYNHQSGETMFYPLKDFCKLGLEFNRHFKQKLGTTDTDFVKYQNFIRKSIQNKKYKGKLDCTELVSEYNKSKASSMLKKEITKFYLISDDLRHLQKHSKESEYKKGQIPLTMSDFLRIPEILSNPDELLLPNQNPKNGQGIAFIKTFADGKQYCILIDKYEDGELSPKTGYKKPLRGLNGFYSVHDRCPAKQSPNLTSVTPKVPRRFVAKITNFFVIPKQNHNYFSGLNGLTESQWANELAKHEDWRYLEITIGDTKDYRNVIIILKPFIINRGGKNGVIQYWMTCKKEEIEYQIKIIDKVFQILIDTFPDWQTKNHIISYKPKVDIVNKGYYILQSELLFTPKESEKFLQVVPFFLKMTTVSPDKIKYRSEEDCFFIPNLKYCKFQQVAEEISPLCTKEMELLYDNLERLLELNFDDAPQDVIQEIKNVSKKFDNPKVTNALLAANIKDVMWNALSTYPYAEHTAKYFISKSKDSKDTRMPKWVNIIYNHLCEKYGISIKDRHLYLYN